MILVDSLLTADFEQFLEYLKTKMGIRRPQEEGVTFKKYIYEIKRARGESMTSWINRSDEALMDMRKEKTASLSVCTHMSSSYVFENCAASVLELASYRQRRRIIQLRMMGVGPSGWWVGADVVVLFNVTVYNGEFGGRVINRYSCVSRM